MTRMAQLVIGPAGAGKSTYCGYIERHLESSRRPCTLVNLDPAAETLAYGDADVDVRELVSLEDVTRPIKQEELGQDEEDEDELTDDGFKPRQFGPNGGLVFCIEYLAENVEWLRDKLDEADPSPDAYYVIDCPGQIELYTHVPAMRYIVQSLIRWDIRVCGVFLVDAAMVAGEASKYLSAVLLATSAMVQIAVPWINVLSKMDLVAARSVRPNRNRDKANSQQQQQQQQLALEEEEEAYDLEDESESEEEEGEDLGDEARENRRRARRRRRQLCHVDFSWVRNELDTQGEGQTALGKRFQRLNAALCDMVEDYAQVRFVALESRNPESLQEVLDHVDFALQYGEDLEPKEFVEKTEEEEEVAEQGAPE